MSTAERTILVAALAGAVAIGLYVRDRHRAGTLNWSRDIWKVLGIAGGLAVFVALLLLAPPAFVGLAIPVIALLAAVYVVRTAKSSGGRLGGWVLVLAAGAGVVSQIIRVTLMSR